MVRDAYSAGGQSQQADSGTAAQPLDLHSSTASLTQELSQLLAQSIAHGQAGKRAAGPVAAGAELANLQALVSASVTQGQRPAQPTFRDGLSSLSYARPVQAPMPPSPAPAPVAAAVAVAPPPAATVGGLLVADPHDEEPMPIPSTWRQPMPNDDERWYRQQLGAAGLGLVAGLIVVVPAVLWLSGWLGGPGKQQVARSQSAAEPTTTRLDQVQPVKVRIATASAEARVAPAPEPRVVATPAQVEPPAQPSRTRSVADLPPVVQTSPAPVVAALARPEPIPPAPVRTRADELMTQARRLIEGKDIMGAREVLQAPETASSAHLMFMLAETFDPSMLAIWQVKPDGITANPERARALYTKARDLGDSRAQQRLEWLK
jgi:hypothetical protein